MRYTKGTKGETTCKGMSVVSPTFLMILQSTASLPLQLSVGLSLMKDDSGQSLFVRVLVKNQTDSQ